MSSFLTLRVPRSGVLQCTRHLRAATPLSRYSAFHSSPVRTALSEQDRHREDIGEEIDGHKQDLLREQKDGTGHWKQELASQSEASVKADREEVEASDETIQKLQEKTSKLAEQDKMGEQKKAP